LNNQKFPAIICIGAGVSQIPVLKSIQNKGYKAIAIDKNPEAIGFKYSDEKLILSTHEEKPIIEALRSLVSKYQFSGLLNRSSGPPVVTAAYVSEAFNLPGVKPETALKIINKSYFIETLKSKCLYAPWHQTINDIKDINWDQISFPAIVKPSISLVGKKGVRIVNNRKELFKSIAKVKKYAFDNKIEIQEYFEGNDVGILSMLDKGVLKLVAIIDEINHFTIDGKVQAVGVAVPTNQSIETQRKLISFTEKIIKAFDLIDSSTPFLISYRCKNNGTFIPIEIHLDLGGDLILEELLPASTDFNFLDFALSIMTSNDMQISEISLSPAAVLMNNPNKNEISYLNNFQVHVSNSRDKLDKIISMKI
jgi:biotin carboxylase